MICTVLIVLPLATHTKKLTEHTYQINRTLTAVSFALIPLEPHTEHLNTTTYNTYNLIIKSN